MGSKSKSSSSSTTGNVSGQMGGLDKYRVSNDQMAGMQQDLSDNQWGTMAPMFDALSQMGTEQMASNPMAALMGQLFGQEQPQQAPASTGAAPQQSAYEQRIAERMQNKGETRQEAAGNQAHALRLGTDYNNDGAVTNDEWAKYQQAQQPQQQQMGNMTPEQMAAIQKMQGYGRR